jgi:hypothetical protein
VGNTMLSNQLLNSLQNDISGYFLVGNRLFDRLFILQLYAICRIPSLESTIGH